MTELDDGLQEIRTEGERMESTLSDHPTASAVLDPAGEAIPLASEAVAQSNAERKSRAVVSSMLVQIHVLLIGIAIGIGIVRIMDSDFSPTSLIRFAILLIIGIDWMHSAVSVAGDEAYTYSKTWLGKLVGYYLDVIMLAPIVALSGALTNESLFYLSLAVLWALDAIANSMYIVRLRGKPEHARIFLLSITWAIDSTVSLGTTLTVIFLSHSWRRGLSEWTGAMIILIVVAVDLLFNYWYNSDILLDMLPKEIVLPQLK